MTSSKMTELVSKSEQNHSLDDFLKDDGIGQQVWTRIFPR